MRRLVRAWLDYWFRDAPLLNLAVCRIVIVATQLRILFPLNYESEAALPAAMYDPLPVLHLMLAPVGWDYRPSLTVIEAIHNLTLAAGALALVGLFTNVGLVLFAAGNVFLLAYQYSFGNFHHPEAPIMIALMILAVSPAGGALSIDDMRKRIRSSARGLRFEPARLLERTSPYAGWPLRLIQWTLALIYLSAAYAKLRDGGLDWTNGYTLRYYLVQDGLLWGSELALWFGSQHFVAQILSWLTLLVEGTFFLAVLFPPLAWFYLPAAAGLHLGIELTLRAPFLRWVALYSAFIPWNRAVRKVGVWRDRHAKEATEVFFDGRCALCLRSVTALDYLDWGGRLQFRDLEAQGTTLTSARPDIDLDDLRAEMHVVGPDGAMRRGFFAFRHLAGRLPLLGPLALLLRLPGAGRIGPRIYAAIARRRVRQVHCDEGACAVHDGAEA